MVVPQVTASPQMEAPPMPVPDALEARSRQGIWQLFILIPAAALLAWMTSEAAKPGFHAEGRIRYLNGIPHEALTALFLGCALVCVGCIGLVLWRRLNPRIELIVDDHGITSRLFWGPGTLAWSAITHIAQRNNWFFVHGTRPDGRRRRLIVNLWGLDHSPAVILAAIRARRPDL
jgi:hypothetical protein